MARAEAGERIDELLDEIAELQRLIDTTPGRSSWASELLTAS